MLTVDEGKKPMMKAVAMAYVPWNMHLVQPQVYVCVCVWICWREHASAIWISSLDGLWQLTQLEKEKGKHVNWHACKHTHTHHTHRIVGWPCYHHGEEPLTPQGECAVWQGVYPPYPSDAEVLRAEYCWLMLNSQWRMRCEPRQEQAHLKCQILGIRDRSVKTLSWLWLTLSVWERLKRPPTGNWYSQGILCTSVLDLTFETQDCFDTTSHAGF